MKVYLVILVFSSSETSNEMAFKSKKRAVLYAENLANKVFGVMGDKLEHSHIWADQHANAKIKIEEIEIR